MRYIPFFLGLLLSLSSAAQTVVDASQLKNLDEKNELDIAILRESRNLDSLVFPTQIWLSDEVDSQFDERFGVILNKKEIMEKISQHKLKDVGFVFRLIIAHEKMHARQMYFIRNARLDFASFSLEQKQLIECQADMCAGFVAFTPKLKELSNLILDVSLYMIRTNPELKHSKGFIPPEFSDQQIDFALSIASQNREAIKLFFELGENEGRFGTHPDAYSREMAFELGYNGFLLNVMSYFPPERQNTITASEWQILNGNLFQMKATLGLLPMDFAPNGSFFDSWSNRTSRKIVHFVQTASKNVLFNVTENRWDTRIENNFLYFKLEVTNNNPDSVIVDMSLPIKLVMRNDKENPLTSKIATAWHAYTILAPGEKKVFNDSVMWAPGTDTTMPRAFYPGQWGSLYYVVTSNPNLDRNYFTPSSLNDGPKLGGEDVYGHSLEKLINKLPSIQRSFALSPIDRLKSGAGLRWLKNADVSYCCYLAKHNFDLKVPFDSKGQAYLTKTLYSDTKLKQSKEELKRIVGMLIDSYPDYKIKEGVDSNTKYPFYEIYNPAGKKDFMLFVDSDYSTYNLILEIYKS